MVQNGQAVSAAVTNAAFVSRTQDTSAAGVVNLEKELLLNHISSTPSNPAAGKTKLYSKGDSRIYFLDSSGVEKLVGANELNDLDSVNIGTPSIGDVLTWDGSNWVNIPSSGGAGGGIPVLWQSFSAAPIEREENNAAVYEYEPGLTQNLFCDIRVPDSYLPGVQIRMKGIFKTDETSGDVLFETLSTLLRIGVDQSSSTTNQQASTNTAITVPGTARVITEVELDLTDSSGEINGVAVSPGDNLRVRLSRGTDTAAGSVFIFKTAWEVLIT
jgi:hypothetical protein